MHSHSSAKMLLFGAVLSALSFASTANAETYSMDLVPNSHFHHGGWNFYGSDIVPTSTTEHDGILTTYAWDGVPDMRHPHVNHQHNVLLIETIQQLTSAREDFSKKAATAPPRTRTARPRQR